MKTFSDKQGQYLAFICYYLKVNGRCPAELDMERYYRVSPPSIHDMVLRLEAGGFIETILGKRPLDSTCGSADRFARPAVEVRRPCPACRIAGTTTE